MVNVEAMACGLPVVASAVGGIPEIKRASGAVVIPGGSSDALAEALKKLIRDPELRQEIAAAGFANSTENFRWQQIYEKYLRLIRATEEKS